MVEMELTVTTQRSIMCSISPSSGIRRHPRLGLGSREEEEVAVTASHTRVWKSAGPARKLKSHTHHSK